MDQNILKKRTQDFALDVIRFANNINRGRTEDILVHQLIRSATSVGANYRAACRARSKAEFLAKMGIVEEEADETMYWLEMLMKAEIGPSDRIESLLNESNELVAIIVSSIRTARKGTRK